MPDTAGYLAGCFARSAGGRSDPDAADRIAAAVAAAEFAAAQAVLAVVAVPAFGPDVADFARLAAVGFVVRDGRIAVVGPAAVVGPEPVAELPAADEPDSVEPAADDGPRLGAAGSTVAAESAVVEPGPAAAADAGHAAVQLVAEWPAAERAGRRYAASPVGFFVDRYFAEPAAAVASAPVFDLAYRDFAARPRPSLRPKAERRRKSPRSILLSNICFS